MTFVPPSPRVLSSLLPSVPSSGILRVLALPDLHLPPRPSGADRILANRAYLDAMDYVVLLGDAVRAYGTQREYADVRRFVEGLKRPYTAVGGNHESWFGYIKESDPNYGYVWEQASTEGQSAALERFQHFYGLGNLWRAQSNALGHWVFLTLDGIGNPKQETLSPSQQQFLLEQIREAGDAPLYIFCHAPLMIERRLDIIYYEAARSGCVELAGELARALSSRRGPTLWISGHVHLHPDHYLYPPYEAAPRVWQIHCPDGRGYSRWVREQHIPQHHGGTFTRHLEAAREGVELVTWDHVAEREIARHRITWDYDRR